MLRPAVSRIVSAAARPAQWGSGLNKGSTEVGHLALRSIMDIVRHKRTSGAVLFLDVVSAFASFHRHMVLSCPASDEQWLRLLVDNGFSLPRLAR